MPDDLDLEHAAQHIGVPAGQLERWTWHKVGPTSNGSLWRPRYSKAELDRWLQSDEAKRTGKLFGRI